MTTMDRTAPARTTTTTPTNGTVQFWDQMLQAAQQAGLDVAALNQKEFSGGSGLGAKPGSAGATIAAGISAAAGVASAMFAGGNFGLGVANAVNSSSSQGQMEVTLVNYSSQPVVLYNCNPSSIDISNLPDPLGEGDNDVVVLTRDSAFGSTTSFELDFLIGAGATSIPFSLSYAYTSQGDPGRWTVTASAGGSSPHPFPTDIQMFGFSFTGTGSYPSFSVYTSPIETGNGAMSIAIYDMATS